MRKDLVFIAVVLDRSGSMQGSRDDALGGFNSFLEEQQKAPGDALFTLVQFDHEYIVVDDGVPIKDVKKLDRNTYVPRGNTALYDAIGRTVNVVEAKLGTIPEADRPARTIVAILSDGMENASQEFKKPDIKKMIEERSSKGWDFLFLSAGLDQFAEAEGIGIAVGAYAATPVGAQHAIRGVSMAVSHAMSNYRTGVSHLRGEDVQNVSFSALAGGSMQSYTDEAMAPPAPAMPPIVVTASSTPNKPKSI